MKKKLQARAWDWEKLLNLIKKIFKKKTKKELLKILKTKNYCVEEIRYSELINKKLKKTYKSLNYVESLLLM